MPSLLDQLLEELPGVGHDQRVYYSGRLEEAQRIVKRAQEELYLPSVRFLLRLERFERQPELSDPKRAAYDVLLQGLAELRPTLAASPTLQLDRSTD